MRVHRIICLLLCLSLLAPLAIHTEAASSSQIQSEIQQLEAQKQELQEKIDELEGQRDENLSELGKIVEQKQVVDQQIALINQQMLNIQEQIQALKLVIADQQEAFDIASAEYEQLGLQYKERIRAMEEQGELSYWAVLFRSNSFSDFLDRLNMVQEIAAADHIRMTRLREAAQKVEAEQQALVQQQTKLYTTSDELAASQTLLDEKRAQSQELMRQLMANAAEFEALLEEQEKEAYKLAIEIANKEDEFDRAVYLEWLAAQPPVPPTQSAPALPETDGDWIMPVPYYILTSVFGSRQNPETGEWHMHEGIDLACAEGTPIYASRGGLVEYAVYSPSAGNFVQLNHGDGYRSIYMHMTHYIVASGQYVQAGQVIGYVGNTGASRGNHLHFGISYNGAYINPYGFIFH